MDNFPKLVESTIVNHGQTIVTSNKGSIVLVAESEWKSLKRNCQVTARQGIVKSIT